MPGRRLFAGIGSVYSAVSYSVQREEKTAKEKDYQLESPKF
jgi:hypothetical protein